MSTSPKNKIIAIVGTTASGKTTLAVKLAYKFNGEVVSADSRQVYKYMDVGSGKDLGEYDIKIKVPSYAKALAGEQNSKFKTFHVPYHCIDLFDPKTEYNLMKYYRDAGKAIKDILSRNKLPIIAGGTGLYVQAIIDGYALSSAKPNNELRSELEIKSAAEVFNIFKKLDKQSAALLSNSEKNNKRRLIRRIERLGAGGGDEPKKPAVAADFLLLGITHPKEILKQRIKKRLDDRINKEGMIEEVLGLHKKHRVSWKRLEGFGLEYKYMSLYLQGKTDLADAAESLNIATMQFAKRQMSWLRRWEKQGRKIYWVNSEKEAIRLVNNFLK